MSQRWQCDSCGKDINSVEEGWIEWLSDINSKKCNDMRIVHHDERCMYNENYEYHQNKNSTPGTHLSYFNSTDGFIRLLEMISDEDFQNNDEVLEIIKRLFVKDYEIARRYFSEAISEDYFEPNTKALFYHTSDIQRTMDYIKKEGIY